MTGTDAPDLDNGGVTGDPAGGPSLDTIEAALDAAIAKPKAKRKRSEQRKMSVHVAFRLYADEAAAVQPEADKRDISLPDYFRAAGLAKADLPVRVSHRNRIPPEDLKIIGALTGQLGRENNNLNQVAKGINSWMLGNPAHPDAREVLDAITQSHGLLLEIRDLLIKSR